MKRLSSSAIKGYRSALAQVFFHRGVDISSSPEISSLVRNFDQEIPPKSRSMPMWDLNLVQNSLRRQPYEPLAHASLKEVTLKSVFLLTLASEHRVSEIHGFSHIASHTRHWSSVTLSLAPVFIAKTQVPGDPLMAYKSITIPALTNILDPRDQGITPCLVRALRHSLKGLRNVVPIVTDYKFCDCLLS